MPIKRVLIMAAGTGGHIIPGLAIANKLKSEDPNIEIQWLGTQKGLESKLVPEQNIKVNFISVWGLRNKSIWVKFLAPFRLLYAFFQSLVIMLKLKPDIVIGMGGFVCGPGGLAAFVTRKKLFIHEQNAVAGFTNTILARFADKVFESFPNSFNKIQPKIKGKLVYTGNPIRKEILEIKDIKNSQNNLNQFNILVLGGSRGAVALNKLIPEFINKLLVQTSLTKELKVVHQCGDSNYDETYQIYKKNNLDNKQNIELIKYIDNIVDFYTSADLIICRSGAMTVSEVACAGIPAIFIPFPHAVDDHQTKNAEFLEKQGAAIIFQQSKLSSENLANTVLELINDESRTLDMKRIAFKCAKIDAVDTITKTILL